MNHLLEIISCSLYATITLAALTTYVHRRNTRERTHLRAITILWFLGVFLVALVVVLVSAAEY